MPVYRRRRRDGTLAPTYSYDFQHRGRRFSGDTGAATKRLAEAVVRDLRRRADGETIDLDAPLTFAAAASRYWHEHGRHLATAKDLWRSFAWLQQHIGASTPLTAIDDDMVARLVARRRGERRVHHTRDGPRHGQPVSSATVNRSVTAPLRMLHERARRTWKRPVTPIEWERHMLPVTQERVREASAAEEAQILANAGEGYAEALAFAILSGARAAEIVGLRWPAVNLLTNELQLTGKGRRTRIVPITGAMRAVLMACHGHDPLHVFTYPADHTRRPAFPGDPAARVRGERYPLTYWGLQTRWRRCRAALGIADLRIHDLRHTAATRLLRASGNLRLAQRLLGHADIRTTTRYAHTVTDDLRAGMEATTPTLIPTPRDTATVKPRK